MAVWKQIRRILDRSLETLVTLVMGVLVLDVSWQVFTRYCMPKPSIWTDELATFLMMWVGLLGASVALKHKAHLGIDYFVLKLSPKRRAMTAVFAYACVALFSLLAMLIGGSILVTVVLRYGQTSAALGVKMGYVYLCVPISGFFLTLYSVEFLIERLVALKRGTVDAEPVSSSEEIGVD
jgi:TRAP-type C4-dicarboxylate transport system permease small subunit